MIETIQSSIKAASRATIKALQEQGVEIAPEIVSRVNESIDELSGIMASLTVAIERGSSSTLPSFLFPKGQHDYLCEQIDDMLDALPDDHPMHGDEFKGVRTADRDSETLKMGYIEDGCLVTVLEAQRIRDKGDFSVAMRLYNTDGTVLKKQRIVY